MALPLSLQSEKTENLTNCVCDEQSTLLLSIWKILLSLRQTIFFVLSTSKNNNKMNSSF